MANYLVSHFLGPMLMRIERLVDPTAEALLQEQRCLSYSYAAIRIETVTEEEATNMFERLGKALGRIPDPVTARTRAGLPWQELVVLSGGMTCQATDPKIETDLNQFRQFGPDGSGVLVSHPRREPPNGKRFMPDDIDWSGFTGIVDR